MFAMADCARNVCVVAALPGRASSRSDHRRRLADVPRSTPNLAIGELVPSANDRDVDLLDEDRRSGWRCSSLPRTTRADGLASRGHDYWAHHHTLELMAEDYRRLISRDRRPAPAPTGLPAHITDDYSEAGRQIARRFGTEVDILRDHA